MSVKYLGVEVVPIEPWLVRSFHTLKDQDRLVSFGMWCHSVPSSVKGKPWLGYGHGGTGRDSRDDTYSPVLEPGDPGERQHRMFLLDTDEGRKIVLYWSGATTPILDWSASNEDIEYYLEWLKYAEDDLVSQAPRKSYRTQRRYETQADLIRCWAELVEHARDFRDRLLGWEWEDGETKHYEDTPVYFEDPGMEYGLGYKVPNLNIFQSQGNVHEVGDVFYYKDTKVFRSDTTVQEAKEYGDSCDLQSDLALAKYLATGGAKDYDFYLEKKVRAKVDRLVLFIMVKSTKDLLFSTLRELKRKFIGSLKGASHKEVEETWGVVSRRAYLDYHRQTGKWRSPQTLDELLTHTQQSGFLFDHLLHTQMNPTFGDQLTEEFTRLRLECQIEVVNRGEFTHQKLVKFMPVKGAQTRQSGHFLHREKKSATLHYLQYS